MATTDFFHLSDLELVELYKKHSDKKFVGELYKRYAHLVYGMCISYFKEKEKSYDSSIEIFEKLFIELKKREVENFKAWLTFVVRNYCISELRKMQTINNNNFNYAHTAKSDTFFSTENGRNEIEEEKMIEKLERALQQLNPFQKKCLELFYYKQMSYFQIVENTGFSLKEVKSHIQNGKRNLKLMITEQK